jgi:hypothetical protein
MFDARRPLGWLLLLRPAMVALAVSAQTLPTTTISDTVYRADGTPSRRDAADFMAGVHHRRPGAVAAGNTSVTLGQQARYRSAWPERERHPRKYDLLRRVPIG